MSTLGEREMHETGCGANALEERCKVTCWKSKHLAYVETKVVWIK